MKVELIRYTNDADRLAAVCAGTCVSKDIPDDPSIKGLRTAIKSGHDSVIEHVSFTFAVSGISRACSHQVVRHRLASYCQQSQRYVNMADAGFIVPPSIREDPVAWGCFTAGLDGVRKIYEDLTDQLHIPEEDARYILPNACCTNMVITMNARELKHFLELRMCGRAQWEIRELACKMYALANRVAPEVMKGAGPACHFTGKCKEAKPCGLSPEKIMARVQEDIKR